VENGKKERKSKRKRTLRNWRGEKKTKKLVSGSRGEEDHEEKVP